MTEPLDPQPPPASYPTTTPLDRRPGSVTAAAWIAMTLSIVGALCSLGLLGLSSNLVDYLRDNAADFNTTAADLPSDSDLKSAVVTMAVIVAAAALIAVATAVATLKRQPWARILLVILSGVSALIAIPMSFLLVGIPWLGGSIAIIALLFTGNANRWFAKSELQRF